MTEKRFVWKVDNDGQGHIFDRITKKRLGQHKKSLEPLNNMWNMVKRFEKHNQELVQENIRLQEDRDYLNNICKSYKDYYGKPIEKAEWFGYIKRCYEKGDVE